MYLSKPSAIDGIWKGGFLNDIKLILSQCFPTPRLVALSKLQNPPITDILDWSIYAFPRALVRRETQTASSAVRSRFADFTFHDDNRYAKRIPSAKLT